MKFQINNITWEIIEKSQEEIKSILNQKRANDKENIKNYEDRYFGITFHDELVIYLDKDLPEQRKRLTLIHELTHCYIGMFITHIDKNYSEEEVCDIVSNSYYVIKDIVDKYFVKEEIKWNK